jgi:uncharacterized protein (DUF2344 family)
MSGDADTNDVTQVRELRRVFDESASQEMRTMQEMEKHISEVSDCIEKLQRFCDKKSFEIKNLKKTLSDPTTGRVISGYSMAKDMIQKLEKKVAEKAKDIMRLKKEVAHKDVQLSQAERTAEENIVKLKEFSSDIARKERLIKEMNGQIIELRDSLQKKDETNQGPQSTPQDPMVQDPKVAVIERNGEIERLIDVITQLQKDLSEKETQQCINKQLSNTMKIRQLEPLAKQSPDVAELLDKLKQETAIIVERLVNANSSQATNSNSPATGLPDKPLRG